MPEPDRRSQTSDAGLPVAPTNDRAEPMRCPLCNARLVELERSEILIDACPECRGIWLDRGELDKILERERRIAQGVSSEEEDFEREITGKRNRTAREHSGAGEEHGRRDPRKRRRGMLEELFEILD